MQLPGLRIQFSQNITILNKYCSNCREKNVFKQTSSGYTSLCPTCTSLKFREPEAKTSEMDEQINKKKNELRFHLRRFNKDRLMIYSAIELEKIGKRLLPSPYINFELALHIIGFIREILDCSDNSGQIIDETQFSKLLKEYIVIFELESEKEDFLYMSLLEDENTKEQYFSYENMRLQVGMGEYGFGTGNKVKQHILENIEGYEKAHEDAIEMKQSSNSLIELFKEGDPKIVDLFMVASRGIQQKKYYRDLLNLTKIASLIDIEELSKWRREVFYLEDSMTISKTRNSLRKKFGRKGNEILDHLIAHNSYHKALPYGLEAIGIQGIKGRHQVHIPERWADIIEILLLGEIEKGQAHNFQEKYSKEFEKQIVREKFDEEGCKTHPGQKDPADRFEIDCYVLDTKKTLWVVEAKSKYLPTRFMESYQSWKDKCREFVDKTGQMSYPETIKEITGSMDQYKQKKYIPTDWEIKDIKGLIVTQLPPIEECYKGIYMIWYREVKEFLEWYYSIGKEINEF